jgi:hypothetical protein
MSKKEIFVEIERQQKALGKMSEFVVALGSEELIKDLHIGSELSTLYTAIDYMQVNLSALTDRVRMA